MAANLPARSHLSTEVRDFGRAQQYLIGIKHFDMAELCTKTWLIRGLFNLDRKREFFFEVIKRDY